MKIAILGYAREGRAAVDYWSHGGNELTICDQDRDLEVPDGVSSQLGPDYLHSLDRFDLIVRTAGLHPKKIIQANSESPQILDKVTTSLNEFMQASPTRNIIGVTGTKGKGTTSTLIFNILEATGHRVHLGGNIGIAPLDLLKGNIGADDWVILELSSYQLIDIKKSPRIAVCLMVEEEHLTWHGSLNEYLTAKQNLFRHQAEDSIAIFNAHNRNSQKIVKASPGLLIPYMTAPGADVADELHIRIENTVICKASELRLLGKHNWQNVCAAITAVWNITQDVPAIRRVVTNFLGLPNRLELVREVDGVHYYNDSFASTPRAAIAAMEAIAGSKVMIIGGFDRGADLNELGRALLLHQQDIRRVILVGAIGSRLEKTFGTHGFTNFDPLKFTTMREIIEHARTVAHPGDKVILSPGFASFDMFKDFEDRGRQFKKYVNML